MKSKRKRVCLYVFRTCVTVSRKQDAGLNGQKAQGTFHLAPCFYTLNIYFNRDSCSHDQLSILLISQVNLSVGRRWSQFQLTLSKTWIYRQANTERDLHLHSRTGNLEKPVNLICMALGCGGKHIQYRHRESSRICWSADSNPKSSCQPNYTSNPISNQMDILCILSYLINKS